MRTRLTFPIKTHIKLFVDTSWEGSSVVQVLLLFTCQCIFSGQKRYRESKSEAQTFVVVLLRKRFKKLSSLHAAYIMIVSANIKNK